MGGNKGYLKKNYYEILIGKKVFSQKKETTINYRKHVFLFLVFNDTRNKIFPFMSTVSLCSTKLCCK